MGQGALKTNVWETRLCTGCGACVGLCPYQGFWEGTTRPIFSCNLPDEEGRCSAFCPRLNLRLGDFYGPLGATPEIGPVLDYALTRASDPRIRARAQHGGTLSALLMLALKEGFIDTALLAGRAKGLGLSPRLVKEPEEIERYSGSAFFVSPTVSGYNEARKSGFKRIGAVATPCQAQAFAKIRSVSGRFEEKPGEDLALVLGVFCGWTLSLKSFRGRLKALGFKDGVSMDTPAGKGTLEIKDGWGQRIEVPIEELRPFINEACTVCLDTTSELADISVGSARTHEPWEEMRTWNQVIVRTELGKSLFRLAVNSGILEVRKPPDFALADLKGAARAKKRKAIQALRARGSLGERLGYLDMKDPFLPDFLKAIEGQGDEA